MTSLQIVSVGASATEFCGVRQYEAVLADALRHTGVEVTTEWWERGGGWGPRRIMMHGRRWVRDLQRRVHPGFDCALWHYSAFTYGPAGVPLLAPAVVRSIAAAGIPLLILLHEYALPWGRGGVRGIAQASTQRIVLLDIARYASGLIVTTQQRKAQLQHTPLVNARPIEYLPIFSPLTSAEPESPTGDAYDFTARSSEQAVVLGVFGYGAGEYLVDVATEALALVLAENPRIRLRLVGSPGPNERALERWKESARHAGCEHAIGATGPLDTASLAAELRRCDILLLPDPAGPTARKTTLAAALAVGRPVVALDGPQRWQHLVEEAAAIVSPPDAPALSAVLRPLLESDDARKRQGARALEFYRRELEPTVIARQLRDFVLRVRGEATATR